MICIPQHLTIYCNKTRNVTIILIAHDMLWNIALNRIALTGEHFIPKILKQRIRRRTNFPDSFFKDTKNLSQLNGNVPMKWSHPTKIVHITWPKKTIAARSNSEYTEWNFIIPTFPITVAAPMQYMNWCIRASLQEQCNWLIRVSWL